jgi:glycosyltransferase involved in cell wall biosynthesis
VTALPLVALALAALPALLFLRNARLFRPPPALEPGPPPRISVLIPARNEERSIGPAVESVLANVGVELEVVVLDDHSEDGTAEVVREIAVRDDRVRLESAPPLPERWCGKQWACYTLSQHARHPVLTFLDADVRLAPLALARMHGFLHSSGAALVSGFPRQETGTLFEKLVIPLINWLLVCYLPIGRMRSCLQPGLGVGCGQWFMTTRDAYEKVGGHAAVKASLHDGIKLPRAYRAAGMMTDISDATDLAVCRMYRSAGQVWNGLAKNAREGMGAPALIVVWTVLLFGGHVLPFLLVRPPWHWSLPWFPHAVPVVAVFLSYLTRFGCAALYRGSWLGAVLHPVGVLVLLVIQWYALLRWLIGKPVGWKGRAHPIRRALPSQPGRPSP